MKIDGKWIRTMPSEDFSKWEEVECVKHSYRWSGNMPQTGEYCCVFCGKPEDENAYNGKAKDLEKANEFVRKEMEELQAEIEKENT